MQLRLRAVHARLNEGEFDLQRFAIANHSALQGRIVSQQAESLRCSWRTRFIDHHLASFHRVNAARNNTGTGLWRA
jgi:hypothetical protein